MIDITIALIKKIRARTNKAMAQSIFKGGQGQYDGVVITGPKIKKRTLAQERQRMQEMMKLTPFPIKDLLLKKKSKKWYE